MQETPQVEIPNAHDNSVWDLAWHPIGYILCSGSNDHSTKFWCRNRPGDQAREKFNTAGFGEQNIGFGSRVPNTFPGLEGPTTPGPFAAGLTRNEGTIPGIGVAMPLSIPSLESPAQGDQKPPLSVPMPLGPPPLPPGPHPSLLSTNQQQAYQQNSQQVQQHQPMPQQMSLPMPSPNMPQVQPSAHQALLPHSHLPRPPSQIQPLNTSSSIPSSMQGTLPITVPLAGPMGMQGNMNQMVPPMPQGHFMGMNTVPSGSGPPGNVQPGGIPNGLLNMQGPSNATGSQMFSPVGGFNRPQTGQMPMMPGLNPFQPGNANNPPIGSLPSNFSLMSGMPPPLPPGPPPHNQTH